MEIYLKKEFLQFTGSFKERGARNALLHLTPEQKKAGVVSASLGKCYWALIGKIPRLNQDSKKPIHKVKKKIRIAFKNSRKIVA